jgi:hypothetical protein
MYDDEMKADKPKLYRPFSTKQSRAAISWVLYREIEKKKLELAVTKNFSWQFLKISIIRCQS